MTEQMAVEYAKRWYRFSPSDEFTSVRQVITAAKDYMHRDHYEFETGRLCFKLIMHFDCTLNEISIEG